MEGHCFFDTTVEALYKEMNRQLEVIKRREDEGSGDGDVYDYYVCQGEVTKSGDQDGYISLSELNRSQNMELFDGNEYVDERMFEDSEELSDDEDSNAEGYYENMMDDWSDEDDGSDDCGDGSWGCDYEDGYSGGEDAYY